MRDDPQVQDDRGRGQGSRVCLTTTQARTRRNRRMRSAYTREWMIGDSSITGQFVDCRS